MFDSKYDFSTYLSHYPKTPPIDNNIVNFAPYLVSQQAGSPIPDSSVVYVFVRGIFGTLMPGNFVKVLNFFKAQGLKTLVAKTDTVGTVEKNSNLLANFVIEKVPPGSRLVFLCHSKGGLDALTALSENTVLRSRTDGVILAQTPRASSKVIESMLLNDFSGSLGWGRQWIGEKITSTVLKSLGWTGGPLDLTTSRMEIIAKKIDESSFPFLVMSLVSWSLRPSSWTDSFHHRLSQIKPQVAHDGQFYLNDLVWPQFHKVGLGGLDHAQPVMGGLGFDETQLWLCLIRYYETLKRS
jgi:hypothetical protein